MPRPRLQRAGRLAAATAVVLWLSGLALAPRAGAYVYWTNSGADSIGRAKLDGSNAIRGFITGVAFPEDVAVDATHIYWTSNAGGAIGRAKLNGTEVDDAFVTGSGEVDGVAVDADHVYWTNRSGYELGRAKLDGTGVEQSFIATLGMPHSVAVGARHLYWVASSPDPPFTGAIGRAKLDGTGVEQFFTGSAITPVTGVMVGLAVDAESLYWADLLVPSIVRSDIDGTGIDVNFIGGADFPGGVAVDARPLPPNTPPETTITKRPPNKSKRRRVKFRFTASEPHGSFECKLDRRPFRPCSSPHSLRRLKRGRHVFRVRAVDGVGNADPSPARDKFKIRR